MSKLIEFKVNEDTYEVFGEYNSEDEVFEPSELDYVLKNGSRMESFGETWAGAATNESDVLGGAISVYVNDNSTVEVVYVCDEIRDYKEQIQSYSHEVDGRKIPNVAVNSYGDIAELIAVSKTGAYYVNEESNVFLATGNDGSLVTNYEAFFESSLMEDYEKGQMIFMTDVVRENLEEQRADREEEMTNQKALLDLQEALRDYESHGHSATVGDWTVATGGYDLNWQVYFKHTPVIDCNANTLASSGGTLENNCLEEKDFLKLAETIKQIYPDVITPSEEKAEIMPWEAEKPKDENYAFTITKTGLNRISEFISDAEEKRQRLLDTGMDTAEEVDLPTVGDIINDIQTAYEPELRSYGHIWDVTDGYETDYPLALELGEDFVKTQVLQVARQGEEPDDDVWVTIKQGNRTGAFIMTVGQLDSRSNQMEKLEDRYGSDAFDTSDEKAVLDLMKMGEIIDVPNLRELPLIDEQSHAMQTAFRDSSQNDAGGNIYINKDNYQEYLGDIFRDDIDPDVSFESFVLDFHDDVIRNSAENVVSFPAPEALESGNDAYVTIYPEFPTHFATRDKGFRDMVRILDDCIKEIAVDVNAKDAMNISEEKLRAMRAAGDMTLEEALNKRDVDKFDFMELMHNAAKSPVIHVGTDRVAGLNWDKQKDRKHAEKVLDGWMKKPGKKIAKEIEEIKYRNQVQGR